VERHLGEISDERALAGETLGRRGAFGAGAGAVSVLCLSYAAASL
jgi:hypothetical protein